MEIANFYKERQPLLEPKARESSEVGIEDAIRLNALR